MHQCDVRFAAARAYNVPLLRKNADQPERKNASRCIVARRTRRQKRPHHFEPDQGSAYIALSTRCQSSRALTRDEHALRQRDVNAHTQTRTHRTRRRGRPNFRPLSVAPIARSWRLAIDSSRPSKVWIISPAVRRTSGPLGARLCFRPLRVARGSLKFRTCLGCRPQPLFFNGPPPPPR